MSRASKKAESQEALMREILAKQDQLKYVRGEEDLEEDLEYELGPSKQEVDLALSKVEIAEKKLAELEAKMAEKEARETERQEKVKAEKEEKSKAKMSKKQEKELKQKEQEDLLRRLQEDYVSRSERLQSHQAMLGIKQRMVANACRF